MKKMTARTGDFTGLLQKVEPLVVLSSEQHCKGQAFKKGLA